MNESTQKALKEVIQAKAQELSELFRDYLASTGSCSYGNAVLMLGLDDLIQYDDPTCTLTELMKLSPPSKAEVGRASSLSFICGRPPLSAVGWIAA